MDPRTGRLSLRVTGDRAALTATQAHEYANVVHSSAGGNRALTRGGQRLCAPMSWRLATLRSSSLSRLRPRRMQTRWSTDSATWTYAELDRSAERIAAGLLTAGMPPGARVGVMLDRSPELIATALGVLKAGAAVVPLDPSYPQARIDAMIDRVRPFRVISEHRRSAGTDASNCDNNATGNRPRECRLRVVHIGFDGGTQGRRRCRTGLSPT